MLALEEARKRVLDGVEPTPDTEVVPVARASGRYLGEAPVARVPSPGFDNAAMDGFALRRSDLEPEGGELPVARTVAAGEPAGELEPDHCVRIWTGAPIPAGADAVVMQEDVEWAGDRARFRERPPEGGHIRRIGEDLAEGAVLAEAGERIGPALISALGTAGLGSVTVRRRPRVLVLATGSELIEPGDPAGPGRVYASNRPAVAALLREAGAEAEEGGNIPDRDEDLRAALEEAAGYDMVVTTGGVSAGGHDRVRPVLEELGRMDFWKVALKPGKPFAFGRVGGSCFFGLPGNPVSALTTARQFVAPAIARWQGGWWRPPRISAEMGVDFDRARPGRLELVPARLQWRDGRLLAHPLPRQGSAMIASFTRAQAFIVVPADSTGLGAGDRVMVEPAGGDWSFSAPEASAPE